MNELITTANRIREELNGAAENLQDALANEHNVRLIRDATKEALADGEAMELAGADMTGFYDANDKALAVSSKAYQTARDAYMVQARSNGLSGSLVYTALRAASEAFSEASLDVAAAKVSFDATASGSVVAWRAIALCRRR